MSISNKLASAGAPVDTTFDLASARLGKVYGTFNTERTLAGLNATSPPILNVSAQTVAAIDVFIKPDGTKLYVSEINGVDAGKIYQYTLSEPYNILSASYDSKVFALTEGAASSNPYIFIGDNGTKLYHARSGSSDIYQYTLSTAWDISTASYASKSYSPAVTTMVGIALSDDGTTLHYAVSGGDDIHVDTLSTAWDISTASAGSSIDIKNKWTGSLNGYTCTGDGRFHFGGSGQNFYSGFLPDRSTIGSFEEAVVYGSGLRDLGGMCIATDGEDWFVYAVDPSSQYVRYFMLTNQSTSYAITTHVNTNYFVLSSQSNSGRCCVMTPDGTKVFYLSTGGFVYEYDLSTPYDVSSAVYNSISKDFSGTVLSALHMTLKPDGMSLYIGDNNNYIYQFNMTTAYDLSTASYASKVADLTGNTVQPAAYFFSPDGDYIWTADYPNLTWYKYTLSTAWDVSTATYASESVTLESSNAAIQSSDYIAGDINDDGTVLYLSNQQVDSILIFKLTTPYDMNTAYYAYQEINTANITTTLLGINCIKFGDTDLVTVTGEEGGTTYTMWSYFMGDAPLEGFGANGMCLADSNNQLILANASANVVQAQIAVADDLSTAGMVGGTSFLASTQTPSIQGVSMSASGTQMGLGDVTNRAIDVYTCTNYNPSSAVYSQTLTLSSAQVKTLADYCLSGDRNQFYVLDSDSAERKVASYSLTSTDNLAGGWSYNTVSPAISGTGTTTVRAIATDSNGEYMYVGVSDTEGEKILQYTMSTPYDVSTMSYDTEYVIPWGGNSNPIESMVINEAGTQILVSTLGGEAVRVINLG